MKAKETVLYGLPKGAISRGRDKEIAMKATGKRTNGWDERDYKLWSDLGQLPSYGRINRTDHLVSFQQVEDLLRKHAEKRYDGLGVQQSHGAL